MFPETPNGKALYMETRDYRNRWRESLMKRAKGDVETLKVYALEDVAECSDFPQFKEALDFAEAEGFLTEEMRDAAQNIDYWSKQLRFLLQSYR